MFTLSRGLLNHMKTKCLSALLATGAIALATPAVANSPDEPSLNFSCQVTEGVPTTVILLVHNKRGCLLFVPTQEKANAVKSY